MTPQQAECPTCGQERVRSIYGKREWICLNCTATAPIEAQEARDTKEIRREADGRYGFDGNWERLCVCGHTLGIHAAQNDTGKRPCFNEDSGIVGATGEPCDCKHFRPSKKHPHPEATQGDELREKLATIEHERWADWQQWVHQNLARKEDGWYLLDPAVYERWERQINTPYAELSDKEKSSDMEQVDRYWPLIQAYLTTTATRMAVEARLDELESIQFIDNKGNELHTPFVQFRSAKDGLLLTWEERLATLQAQLKGLEEK